MSPIQRRRPRGPEVDDRAGHDKAKSGWRIAIVRSPRRRVDQSPVRLTRLDCSLRESVRAGGVKQLIPGATRRCDLLECAIHDLCVFASEQAFGLVIERAEATSL